jgi:hypothetical protein
MRTKTTAALTYKGEPPCLSSAALIGAERNRRNQARPTASVVAAEAGTTVTLRNALTKARQNPARALHNLGKHNLTSDDAFKVAMICVSEPTGAVKALRRPRVLARFTPNQLDELGATAMANAPLRVNNSQLIKLMSRERVQRVLSDAVVPKLLEQDPERLLTARNILKRLPEEARIRVFAAISEGRFFPSFSVYDFLDCMGKLSVNETQSLLPLLIDGFPRAIECRKDIFTFHDHAEATEWLRRARLSRARGWEGASVVLYSDLFSPGEKLVHFRQGLRADARVYPNCRVPNVVPPQELDLYTSILQRADSFSGTRHVISSSPAYANLGEVPPEAVETAKFLLTRYPEAFFGLSHKQSNPTFRDSSSYALGRCVSQSRGISGTFSTQRV